MMVQKFLSRVASKFLTHEIRRRPKVPFTTSFRAFPYKRRYPFAVAQFLPRIVSVFLLFRFLFNQKLDSNLFIVCNHRFKPFTNAVLPGFLNRLQSINEFGSEGHTTMRFMNASSEDSNFGKSPSFITSTIPACQLNLNILDEYMFLPSTLERPPATLFKIRC
ncbi:hypothetical protein CEXT_579621 [Caerostris extrusa]|uniref:Uncharacterized protein n=1 Tax=Caerostris extrusa TaxID=172846 RepID=A0AAV4V1D6_CAEEX|nr:hypothetical protein CEXT_579621 [Caerostris extrusa]